MNNKNTFKPALQRMVLFILATHSALPVLANTTQQHSFSAAPIQGERLSEFLIRQQLTATNRQHHYPSMLLGRASLLNTHNLELTKLRTLLATKEDDVPSYLMQWAYTWQATGPRSRH